MIFKTLNGRERNIPINRYRINWDSKRKISGPQFKVKAFLRPYWQLNTVFEELRLAGSKMRLDFLNISSSIAIEVSPASTHAMYNPFMHGSLSGYRNSLKRDLLKEQWCAINEFTLVTLIDEDIANLSAELFLERFGVTL